jgi:hypothetical protein
MPPRGFQRCRCSLTSTDARCDPHGDRESPTLKDNTSFSEDEDVRLDSVFRAGESVEAADMEDDGGGGTVGTSVGTSARVAESLTHSVFVPAAGNGTHPRAPPLAASSVASDICKQNTTSFQLRVRELK